MPLGWPSATRELLAKHYAGQAAKTEPNDLFRLHTDLVIKTRLGKTPLEVGADRIARTTVSAFTILQELGDRFNSTIPLAWKSHEIEKTRSCLVI